MSPFFAFRNQPIATPRAASELRLRDGPDFKGIAQPNIPRTGIQRPDQFLTASSAARGRRSEPQRYGEQRSARASVKTPALRRAAQREGVGPNTNPTASGAARAPRSIGCCVVGWGGRSVAGWGGPASGGPGWRAASPPAAAWWGGGVRRGGSPPRRPPRGGVGGSGGEGPLALGI